MNRMLTYMDPFANIVGYAYNARGDRTQIIYPGNLAVSYTFDADGHMLSLSDWMGNSVSYSYEPSGRPVTVTNANATITSYAYQFGYRLSALGNATSDGTVINSYQYSLDGDGNQIDVAGQEPVQPAATSASASIAYQPGDRIQTAGPAVFTHDANGNRLSQAGANPSTFTYDYLNRLTAVTADSATAQYAYDGLGRRLIRSCN